MADLKWSMVTLVQDSLAAIRAASLQTFAISAPENPGVKAERFFARASVFSSSVLTLAR